MGQSPSSKYYTDNSSYHILVQGNADIENGKVVPRVWTKKATKFAEIDDIIFSVRAPVGEIGKTKYNVAIGRGVASIKADEFIFQFLSKLKSENFWKKLSTGSTFESINSDNLKNIQILVPSESEKIKIGQILKMLDNLITLYQRKNNLLNSYKKQLINKLIPIENSTNYELTDLSKILVEKIIKHPENEKYPLVSFTVEKGVTPKTERYERGQLVKGDRNTKVYKATELDDIVYNPANLKFGAISRNSFGKAVFSPIYITFEVKQQLALPIYLELIVTQSKFINKALRFQQGTVYERQSVSPRDLLKLKIVLPDKMTQEKLSNLIIKYNGIITSTTDYFNQLTKLKKELLDRLFI